MLPSVSFVITAAWPVVAIALRDFSCPGSGPASRYTQRRVVTVVSPAWNQIDPKLPSDPLSALVIVCGVPPLTVRVQFPEPLV